MKAVRGASWASTVAYACPCGVVFRALRWRWVDREAQPDEAQRVADEGPIRGVCPSCNSAAVARTDWVELAPSREEAILHIGPEQRHRLVELVQEHVKSVGERVTAGSETWQWLLRPTWTFDHALRVEPTRPVPVEVEDADVTEDFGVDELQDAHAADEDIEEDTARRRPPADPGVPKPVGATPWPAPRAPTTRSTHVATLEIDRSSSEESVTLDLELDEASRAMWGQAALEVRPVHLRGHGYPLAGVRLVASYVGRNAVIDGVVDVGSDAASEVFASLSRRFRVLLILRGENTPMVRREVGGRDLERNAALCLESARVALARREYPPEAYEKALDDLSRTSADERLRRADHALVAGAYRHLIAPRETWLALEELEAASDKSNLAHLLEIDGLAVDEYESIRKRVLAASVEHGLCAPRRFWRRILASGLADDFDAYATRLAQARAEADQDGDDLDPDQRAAAWARIAELCDIKQLEYPPELRRKLGITETRRRSPEAERPAKRPVDPDAPRSRSAAGEIQARPAGRDGHGNLREQLRDRSLRLRVASAALARGSTPEAIDSVFAVIDQFNEEELLAILPAIAELGTQAVVALHDKLESVNPRLRQAAAILLGLARDSSSIAPLLRRLMREDSKIWMDVARAIGSIGPSALERLCGVLRQGVRSDSPIDRGEMGHRVARAMAEVAIADPTGSARDAVLALSHSLEPEIAVTANRALATIDEVRLLGAQVRGERSLIEVTQLRGFARRAYEAITVPELDVLDEELEAELI